MAGFDDFSVDVEAEDNGEWIQHPDKPGYHVKVRSIHYPEYRRWLRGRMNKARRNSMDGNIPPDLEDKIICEGIAKFILIDWDGFGEAYSQDKAQERLADRRYRKFRDFVMMAAQSVGDDELVEQDEDQGNFEKSSGGKQSTGHS